MIKSENYTSLELSEDTPQDDDEEQNEINFERALTARKRQRKLRQVGRFVGLPALVLGGALMLLALVPWSNRRASLPLIRSHLPANATILEIPGWKLMPLDADFHADRASDFSRTNEYDIYYEPQPLTVDLSADGKTLAIGESSWDGSGRIMVYQQEQGFWQQSKEETLELLLSPELGRSIAMSADGSTLAASLPRVNRRQLENEYIYQRGSPQPKSVPGYVAFFSDDRAIPSLSNFDGSASSIALSGDGTRCIIGAQDEGINPGTVRLFRLETNATWTFEGEFRGTWKATEYAETVAMSEDGNTALITSMMSDGVNQAKILEYRYGNWSHEATPSIENCDGESMGALSVNGTKATVSVFCEPRGQGGRQVTATWIKTKNGWNYEPDTQVAVSQDKNGLSLAVSGDGRSMATGWDGGLAYYRCPDGVVWRRVALVKAHRCAVHSISFSADGTIMAISVLEEDVGRYVLVYQAE